MLDKISLRNALTFDLWGRIHSCQQLRGFLLDSYRENLQYILPPSYRIVNKNIHKNKDNKFFSDCRKTR